MEVDSPYRSPQADDSEPLGELPIIARDERRLLAKSRVYMFLFSLAGYPFAAFFSIQVLLHIHWWNSWDIEMYDLMRKSPFDLLLTGASRFFYAITFGAMSYTLWRWAVAIRAGYSGRCNSQVVAARQLSFWRAAAATVFVAIAHTAVITGYVYQAWTARIERNRLEAEYESNSPFEVTDGLLPPP